MISWNFKCILIFKILFIVLMLEVNALSIASCVFHFVLSSKKKTSCLILIIPQCTVESLQLRFSVLQETNLLGLKISSKVSLFKWSMLLCFWFQWFAILEHLNSDNFLDQPLAKWAFFATFDWFYWSLVELRKRSYRSSIWSPGFSFLVNEFVVQKSTKWDTNRRVEGWS